MEALIERFLSVSSGYGYGSGDGSGYGSGYGSGDGSGSGSGDGYGSGDGSGDGDGDGSGSGSGDGSGITAFEGQPVHSIDGVPTLIKQVRGNVARGQILRKDLTLEECFIVKVGNHFAHGETLASAKRDAEAKAFEDLDEDERIDAFREQFKPDKSYPGSEFFEWHAKLTGSCEQGRKAFVADNRIDLAKLYTVAEFVDLTKNAYGGELVRRLVE